MQIILKVYDNILIKHKWDVGKMKHEILTNNDVTNLTI